MWLLVIEFKMRYIYEKLVGAISDLIFLSRLINSKIVSDHKFIVRLASLSDKLLHLVDFI